MGLYKAPSSERTQQNELKSDNSRCSSITYGFSKSTKEEKKYRKLIQHKNPVQSGSSNTIFTAHSRIRIFILRAFCRVRPMEIKRAMGVDVSFRRIYRQQCVNAHAHFNLALIERTTYLYASPFVINITVTRSY